MAPGIVAAGCRDRRVSWNDTGSAGADIVAHRPKTTRGKEAPRNLPPAAAAPTVPPPAIPRAWRRHAVPLLVLWGLALLAYANSFRSGLVFDNYYVIGQDSRIQQATARNSQLILQQDYWYKNSASSLYRPLTTFSYLFNYAVLGNGAAPAGYHWVNFALHAVNIALVYLLGWLLFAEFWPAFAMAAIWALHPILTESVTNIVGRADLLAAFGVLAALLCYARSVAAGGRRAVGWLAALLGATTIGVFSKESGVVAIAAVFFYDIAYCRGAPWRRRAPGYLATALPVGAFLLVRDQVLSKLSVPAIPFTDNPLFGADFWTGRLTAVKVLGKYLWLLLWPSHLSCDYSYNQIPLLGWRFDNWEDWKAVVALAVCAGAAVLAVACYRRAKPVFFFIAFYFASLAPTANLAILVGTIMAERFLYLPSIGFAGCLVWAAWAGYRRLGSRWPAARAVALAALALVCLGLGARTFARNADWLDERSLWASAARLCPASYKVHHHLAGELARLPEPAWDAACSQIERALAILEPLPDDEKVAAVYANAGGYYREKGNSLAAAGQNGGAAGQNGGAVATKGGAAGQNGGVVGQNGGAAGQNGGAVGQNGAAMGQNGGAAPTKGGAAGQNGGAPGTNGAAAAQTGAAAWYRKSLDVLLEGERVDLAWNRETARRNSLQGKTIAITGWPPLYLELGRTYRTMGESQKALEAFARGRWIDPRAEFFHEIAATYRGMGNPEQAAVTLLQGVTMEVGGQALAAEVVDLYRQTAPRSCALTGSGSSAALNFECPLVRSQLCAAGRDAAVLYRQRQQESEAVATATAAVRSLGCPADMFR